METQIWMPGADRLGTDLSGGTLLGGPPRCTWHITYDKLLPKRPTFMNVMRYLDKINYEPTLGWDPLTGKIVQFIPANRSAKALENHAGGVETNRMGSVHVQIEAFFTPGMMVKGIMYAELTDTPMIGLDKILAWTDSLGIPRVWTTVRGSRSVSDWKTKAGHRAHYNVPENSHTDIVGASVRKLLMLDKPITPETGDFVVDDVAKKEITAIVRAEIRTVLGNANDDADKDETHYSLADVQRDIKDLTNSLNALNDLVLTMQPPAAAPA